MRSPRSQGCQPPAGPPRALHPRRRAPLARREHRRQQEWNDPRWLELQRARVQARPLCCTPAPRTSRTAMPCRSCRRSPHATARGPQHIAAERRERRALPGTPSSPPCATRSRPSLVSINAMNYTNSLGAVAANKQDAYRKGLRPRRWRRSSPSSVHNELEIRARRPAEVQPEARQREVLGRRHGQQRRHLGPRGEPGRQRGGRGPHGRQAPAATRSLSRCSFHNGDVVAINNRGLAALSLAGMRPVNIIFVPQAPTRHPEPDRGERHLPRGRHHHVPRPSGWR